MCIGYKSGDISAFRAGRSANVYLCPRGENHLFEFEAAPKHRTSAGSNNNAKYGPLLAPNARGWQWMWTKNNFTVKGSLTGAESYNASQEDLRERFRAHAIWWWYGRNKNDVLENDRHLLFPPRNQHSRATTFPHQMSCAVPTTPLRHTPPPKRGNYRLLRVGAPFRRL